RPTGRPVPVNRADTEPVRLRTRMHLAGVRPAVHGFRVLARLADGDTALVCLGAARQGGGAAAPPQPPRPAPGPVGFAVPHWGGRLGSGRWENLRPYRDELELPRRRAPRRRRERVPETEE